MTFGFVKPQAANHTRPTKNSNIQHSPITTSSLPSHPISPLPMGDLHNWTDNGRTSMLKHRPYLSNFGNWLDIISVICYWVDLALMKINYTDVSVFKGFGAARPLRLVGIIPGTAVSMK
jgi:hypothetical protein